VTKHTQGEWKLVDDAQGPCMVMHPTRKGVAIASLTSTFKPTKGFHDDWMVAKKDGTLDERHTRKRIEERNANARLIAAAPSLLSALHKTIWPEHHRENGKCVVGMCSRCEIDAAIAKAEGLVA
jgi:hypothetical protein